MANTNEVEQLNLQVGMDGANAQETLKLILGSLSGIQTKLLAIGKTPINIGGGYTQVTSELKIIQEVMGKMNAQLKTNSTTWNDVAGYAKEYGKDIANAEAKVESLNKSITRTKNLEKELNQQKEFNNKLSLKYDKDALANSKKAEADIAKAKNYNNNLAMKEQITQIKQLETQQKKYEADIAKAKDYNNKLQLKYDKEIEASRKKAEDEIAKIKNYNNTLSAKEQKAEIKRINDEQKKAEADIAKAKNYNNNLSAKYDRELEASRKKAEADIIKAKNYNNNLSMKEQIAQQKIAETKKKATLDEQIATAKVALARNAEASAMNTSLGRAQLKSKQLIAELSILKKAEQTEENIARIQKLQNSISMQGATIRAARLKEAEALQRMNDKEAEYNSVMSLHSAKRALGYTALFAGIGAVTGAFGAMISNVMEADLQMRTLGAVLKLNLTQARDLSESVRTLGETYGGSLKDIEGVALALARAGIATKDMIPATEIVLRMARLTGDTFEQSASAIISFQQVFGDTTNIETLGNKLAYVANMSRLSTQDIGTFANYALAAAKAVGLTEDAVGGLATAFSVAGSNASTIGTQIRTITAIFSENSKDVVEFFNGIGVSQENMRNKLQQGGTVSNQAMKDFIEVLSNVDNMTFNKLTGSMDKLTVNSLNLMRNNKDNVTKFMNELEAGAQGQLKVVDSILEAHKVTFEKWWNEFLNFSQEQVTNLEETLSDESLINKISKVTNAINNPNFKNKTEYKDSSKEDLLKKLAELKMIQKVQEDTIKLGELEAKIDKSSGDEYQKLTQEKIALIIKLAQERESLETKTVNKTKEQIALDIQAKELALETSKAKLKELDTQSNEYTALTTEIRKQEDALKKLNRTASTATVAQVAGTSLAEIAKDIQDKVSTGDTNVLVEINNLTQARAKAIEDLSKQMEAYYAFEFKNNKEVADHIREVAGGDANQVASKEGLLKLQAEAIEKMEYGNVLTASLQDKTANVDAETRKYVNSIITANSTFVGAYNKLAELLGLQKVAFKTAEEAQQDVVNATLEQLDVEGKLEASRKAKEIYFKGGTELQAKKAELETLRKTTAEQDKIDTTAKGRGARALTLAKAEEDYAKSTISNAKTQQAELSAILELQGKIEVAKAKIAGIYLTEIQLAENLYKVELQKAKEQDSAGNKLEAEVIRQEALAKVIEARKKDETDSLTNRIELSKLDFDLLEQTLRLKGMEIPLEERVTKLRELATQSYELNKDLANQILDPQKKAIALSKAEVDYKKDQVEAQELLIKKEKALIEARAKVTDLEHTWQVTLGNAIELTEVEKQILEIEKQITENQLNRQDAQPELDRLARLKQEQSSYVGINKAITDYNAKAKDLNASLENIANGTISSMESNLLNFFDTTSEGWLNWHSLVTGILNDIYKQLLQELFIKQLVSGIASGVSGAFSSTTATAGSYDGVTSSAISSSASYTPSTINYTGAYANGGMIPTKGYASGGLLTGGSGLRDDIYLGNVGGTRVFAMGGEFITQQDSVNASTRPTLDYINQTGSVPTTTGATAVSVSNPVTINVENQTGQSIDASMVQQLTKTNSAGEEEKVINIILKRMNNDLSFRTAVRGGR